MALARVRVAARSVMLAGVFDIDCDGGSDRNSDATAMAAVAAVATGMSVMATAATAVVAMVTATAAVAGMATAMAAMTLATM